MGKIFSMLLSIVCGAFSGWAGGKLMHSDGSILRNIVLGIVGGAVAGALFNLIGINFNGYIGGTICGIIGACLLLFIWGRMKK